MLINLFVVVVWLWQNAGVRMVVDIGFIFRLGRWLGQADGRHLSATAEKAVSACSDTTCWTAHGPSPLHQPSDSPHICEEA